MIEWMVWHSDSSGKKVELFNIFSHYHVNREINELLLCHMTKEEFAAKVKDVLLYYFWGKSEYEIFISPWHDGEVEKIDIYQQVMANFKPFINYLWQLRDDCEIIPGGYEED